MTLCATAVLGCSGDPGPPLTVSDVVVYAPLTANGMAVAYLTINNESDADVTVNGVSSPEFGRAAIHETKITDGVARMSARESLTVPARDSVRLEEGGIHLMLMDPYGGAVVGDRVSLHLTFAQDGLLMVDAELRSRVSGGESY